MCPDSANGVDGERTQRTEDAEQGQGDQRRPDAEAVGERECGQRRDGERTTAGGDCKFPVDTENRGRLVGERPGRGVR